MEKLLFKGWVVRPNETVEHNITKHVNDIDAKYTDTDDCCEGWLGCGEEELYGALCNMKSIACSWSISGAIWICVGFDLNKFNQFNLGIFYIIK